MRIVPVPDELTAPYWAAAADHRLALQRCACGRLAHPPVARCPACHSDAFTWPTLSGRGRVHAFTAVHHSVHPVSAGQTPYLIALVELEEGPRLLTNLRDCAPEDVSIGLAVEVVFEALGDDVALPQFTPEPGDAAMSQAMTIDGRAVDGRRHHDVVDPATARPFATAPECDDEQLDAAVAAAQRAFPAWSEDEEARRAALADAAQRLAAHAADIAALLTAEQGKPLAMAEGELMGAVAGLRAAAVAPLPREIVQDDREARIEAVGRPLGVVAAITPWNFPVVITVNKLAPALLCGNTVVAKPSPFTPLATLAAAAAIRDAFPPGVLNVVSGGDVLGARLAGHPGVRKVTFTGSVSAGRAVAAAAAQDLKRVTLELGGNDAAILLEDFDAAAMTEGLFWGAFLNSGQVCAAVKRVYVPEHRRDEVAEALATRARAARVGPGTEPGVELGPLQNRAQRDRVERLVDGAVAAGARCVTGGARRDGDGYFYEPTILTGAQAGMAIVDEEQFGPALPVLGYRDLDAAVAAANATRYGLSGSVWSADPERAAQVSTRLRCGTAWVNTHALPLPAAPFGGRDWSGIGVEGGRWGLEGFVDWQTTYVGREATTGAGGGLAGEDGAR